jgi:hypothetical protein
VLWVDALARWLIFETRRCPGDNGRKGDQRAAEADSDPTAWHPVADFGRSSKSPGGAILGWASVPE